MMLNVECKKCGTNFKLAIGEKTLEQTKETLSKMTTFDFCPGNHVELSSPLNYLILKDIVKGNIQTEEEWLSDMKKKGYKLISNDEIHSDYTCTGFCAGMFVGFKKDNPDKQVVLDHMRSPEGNRYYY